jgi:hypothetical protein
MDNRRKTVNVECSVPNGIVMQLHNLPQVKSAGMEFMVGDRVTLKGGGNPGVDKEFFDFWMEENKNLSVVEAGLITSTDEEEPATKEVTEQPVDDKSAERKE